MSPSCYMNLKRTNNDSSFDVYKLITISPLPSVMGYHNVLTLITLLAYWAKFVH